MSSRILRATLRIVAAAGIPGVIAGSIAGNDAVAITFGGITAVAAFGLILVTTVTTPPAVDQTAEALESRIEDLIAAGAEEVAVRALVADAVRLGARTQDR